LLKRPARLRSCEKTKGNSMKKAVRTLSLAVTVVLAVSGFSAYASDSSGLQGKWKGREAGRPTEGARLLTISGNTLEFRAADTNEWYKGTFTLQEDKNPKQLVGVITACAAPEYLGKTVNAIYRIESGTLTLTGNEPGNAEVPKSFDAPGSRKFVLKKSSE
jgi:uncharacterized protein (TIGR03067 family)